MFDSGLVQWVNLVKGFENNRFSYEFTRNITVDFSGVDIFSFKNKC